MEEKSKGKDLNFATCILIYLLIAGNAISIFASIIPLFSGIAISFAPDSDVSVNVASVIVNVVFSSALVVSLYYVNETKRWALLLFFCLEIIYPFIVTMTNGGYDFAYDLGTNSVKPLLACIVMSIFLLFKKNGVSGWKTILK